MDEVPRIFFSYASEDSYWVDAFKNSKAFKNIGVVRVLDFAAEDAGYGPLAEALDDQINRSAVVMAFVSADYTKKKWTVAELEKGLSESQRRCLVFVPIMLDADAGAWWKGLRNQGKLSGLSHDYAYVEFFDNGGRRLVIRPGDTSVDEKIARLAKQIKRDLENEFPSAAQPSIRPAQGPAVVDISGLPGTGSEVGLIPSINAESIRHHYLSDYPGQRYIDEANLDGCDLRFANLVCVEENRLGTKYPFHKFVEYLRDAPRDKRVLVVGHGGGGKSALLKIASIELNRHNTLARTIFLNFAILRSDAKWMKRANLQSEIDRLAPQLMNSGVPTVVFLDELYGYPEERDIIAELERILKRNHPTIVMAYGKDHYDQLKITKGIDDVSYIDNIAFDLELNLKNISLDNSDMLLSVSRGMLQTSGFAVQGPSADDIESRLKELRFSYANQFVISLVIDNFRKGAFRAAKNSTAFILLAMKALCGGISSDSGRSTLEDISIEALLAYSNPLLRATVSEGQNAHRKRYHDVFGHFPKIVQTALIANAIVHLLTKAYTRDVDVFEHFGIDKSVFLRLVFANDVNSCVKDLLENESVERRVLDTAERLLSEVDIFSLSYALYLFGRARSHHGRQRAGKAFYRAKALLSRGNESVAGIGDISGEEKYRRLAFRSLAISLALNGDSIATDDYIRCLFEDPIEDSLNRSFHLEYYGDQSGVSISVDLSLHDNGGAWKRTKEILGGKIRDALGRKNCTEYDRVRMATYYLLVRYRLEIGTLSQNERNEDRELAQAIVSVGFDLGALLQAFLDMMIEKLERSRFDMIDAIMEFYMLKAIPRKGWKERGFTSEDAQIETVASHTWGAMLLADTLCDWPQLEISNEDRLVILQLLLTHDIAEAYIGDYTPDDGETKNKETGAMARVQTLSTFHGLRSALRWRKGWDAFENRMSRAASLAHDFDKLDALLQTLFYADRFPSRSNRKDFLRYNVDRITSPQVREIAHEIINRVDMVNVKNTN